MRPAMTAQSTRRMPVHPSEPWCHRPGAATALPHPHLFDGNTPRASNMIKPERPTSPWGVQSDSPPLRSGSIAHCPCPWRSGGRGSPRWRPPEADHFATRVLWPQRATVLPLAAPLSSSLCRGRTRKSWRGAGRRPRSRCGFSTGVARAHPFCVLLPCKQSHDAWRRQKCRFLAAWGSEGSFTSGAAGPRVGFRGSRARSGSECASRLQEPCGRPQLVCGTVRPVPTLPGGRFELMPRPSREPRGWIRRSGDQLRGWQPSGMAMPGTSRRNRSLPSAWRVILSHSI